MIFDFSVPKIIKIIGEKKRGERNHAGNSMATYPPSAKRQPALPCYVPHNFRHLLKGEHNHSQKAHPYQTLRHRNCSIFSFLKTWLY